MVSRKNPHWIFRMVNVKANQLYLTGEFNDWSTKATPMQQVEPHIWEVSIELQPATYRFRYVTDDGRWFTDYAAFGVERNDYDGWDSLVYVPHFDEPVQNVCERSGLPVREAHHLNDLMGLVLNITRKGVLLCDDEDDVLQSLSRLSAVSRPAAAERAAGAPGSNPAPATRSTYASIENNPNFRLRKRGKPRRELSTAVSS